MGRLTLDCNNRIHEGALQSEAPLSAQRWYASGAVFMQLCKAMRARGSRKHNGARCAAGTVRCSARSVPSFLKERELEEIAPPACSRLFVCHKSQPRFVCTPWIPSCDWFDLPLFLYPSTSDTSYRSAAIQLSRHARSKAPSAPLRTPPYPCARSCMRAWRTPTDPGATTSQRLHSGACARFH